MIVIVLLMCAWACQGREFADKMDRYLIACHTTDFMCFKRQYTALRDNVLLGNTKLAIDQFEPYAVQYGPDCVRLEGWTDSELVGIGMDSTNKELTMALELPVRIKQVKNDAKCAIPEKEFTNTDTSTHNGTLMEFTANATVSVTFPFSLLKRKGDVYLMLDEEDVDALIDIPVYILDESEPEGISLPEELAQLLISSSLPDVATELNQSSDWAYNMVQHIDAARDFALPFTTRLRTALERIPFRKLVPLFSKLQSNDGNHEELRELLKYIRHACSYFGVFYYNSCIYIQKS